MKFIIILSLLVSCGKATESVTLADGKDGHGCVTEAFDRGSIITCGNTTSVVYNGNDGINGLDGADGQDGVDGIDGQDGATGPQGAPGVNGTTTVVNASSITTITVGSCTPIPGSSKFVSANGQGVKVHLTDECKNQGSIELNNGQSLWLSDTMLAVKSKDTFKVINFGV